MNRSIGDELSGLEGREEKKKRKKEKKKRRVEEQMRVSRLAKSWNTLVAIRSKILSKLSSLLPPSSSLLSPLFLSNWFGLFEKILPLVIENSPILDLLERSNFADSLYFEKKKKNREDL